MKGGDRVVEEIMNVIRQEMEIRQSPEGAKSGGIRDVTISILGNSLGGSYGRYAIAKLTERCERASEGIYVPVTYAHLTRRTTQPGWISMVASI